MSKLAWGTIVLAVVLSLGLGTGCRKNAAAEKQIEATLKQPLARELMTAIDKKDYEKVIPAWLQARMGATNEEQRIQFAILTQEAKLRLFDPATTNAQAADALQALRMTSTGR